MVSGLTKHYPDALALTDLHLELQRGEIVGLLGRNGAGKSTTVRLVVGLERPTAGHVRVFGLDPSAAARQNCIGYCSQDVAIYASRSVLSNLVFFGQIAGLPRSDAISAAHTVADRLGFSEHLQRPSNDLSGGLKRRLHLGIALVGRAPLLILDEPTAGVDIESRELIIDLVQSLADEGRAILYTSHDLGDVERLCDRVTILSRGVACATGSLKDLAASVGELIRLEFEDRAQRDLARGSLSGAQRSWGSAGLDIQLDRTQSAAAMISLVQDRGWNVRRIEVLAPGLESIFLQITRGEDDEERSA